jgi:hypothetical protein
MKKYLLIAMLALAPLVASATTLFPTGGGTGSTTLSGILIGNGTSPVRTLTIGSNLTLTGTTLNASGGGGASFSYPFPSNATSTSIAFNGGLTGVLTGSVVGNASTATALAANPTNCSAGNYPLGVDASGNVENCTAAGGGASFAYPFPSNATSTSITFNGGLTGVLTGSLVGNASTATALAANGTNCSAGNYPLGVDASGNVESCTTAAVGTVTSVTATNPLFSTGGATPVISTIFGTTSTWGLGNNGIVMTGATGIPFSQSTSSPIALNISGNASTVTTNANLSGVVTSVGNVTSYGSQAAGVLGNVITGNTGVLATSTLYGAVQNGKVLAGLGGVLAYVATTTDSCSSGVTCSYSGGTNSFSISNSAITNAMLANSTISGVALGSNLNSFSVGSDFTGTSYNGSSAISDWALKMSQPHSWIGLQSFANASSTLFSSNQAWFGATATSTFTSSGFLGVGTSSPWAAISVDRSLGIASSSILVTEATKGATSTNTTIDWRDSNSQLYRTGASATTINFTGYAPGQQLKLIICNPNAVAGAITWGTQVLWTGGTAPSQTTTANKCDVWSFIATSATSTPKIFGAMTPSF